VDDKTDAAPDTVQVEISRDVLLRLLRERSLVASEVHYLNAPSFRTGWQVLKRSLTGR
jgi:hypothetical protein